MDPTTRAISGWRAAITWATMFDESSLLEGKDDRFVDGMAALGRGRLGWPEFCKRALEKVYEIFFIRAPMPS
jgi:hypothetical protein